MDWGEVKFFPVFVRWWSDSWVLWCPWILYIPNEGHGRSLPVSAVGLMGLLLGRTGHPHCFFFTAMKITALQGICRLHSSGGKLSWCLYLVLIVGGSLLCWAHLFDILNLPKTDGAPCSSTLANWLMPFCNLSSSYVVKLQSFSVFLLLGWCCLGCLYSHQKGAVLL